MQVKALLSNDVDLHTTDHKGRTALHIAATEGHVGVLRALVAAGGLDLLTRKSNTDRLAHEYAAFNNDTSAEQVLQQAKSHMESELQRIQELHRSCRQQAQEFAAATYDPSKGGPLTLEETTEIAYFVLVCTAEVRAEVGAKKRFAVQPRELVCGEC